MRKLGLNLGTAFLLVVVLLGLWIISRPERGTIGSVNTKFRLLGPDDKIMVDGFDDPKVEGVACHISRAQTGGMKGAFGVAARRRRARHPLISPLILIGPIWGHAMLASLVSSRRSLNFKTLQDVRFFDHNRSVLVYVAYSDRIVEGSPKNSISSVPIMTWPENH